MTGNDPLSNPDFNPNDLAALFSALSGLNTEDQWQTAAQIASSIANEGQFGANVEPLVRMAIEDLSKLAMMHVANQDLINLSAEVIVRPVSKSQWAAESIDAYKPFFSRFGEALGSAITDSPAQIDPTDPMAAIFGQMFTSMGPMLVSASAGSMIGHLGITSMGQYELPVPRPTNTILVVPETIDARAQEWGFNSDELRLWILIHELVAHSVIRIPHVAAHLERLLIDFASAFRPDPDKIQAEFGNLTDMSQLAQISEKFNDPEMILALMRTPAHDLLAPQINALASALLGYIGHFVGQVCEGLLPNHRSIQSRFRQKMIYTDPADRFMEQLLGLDISDNTFERGDRFVSGIRERAGDLGLARLWQDELDLPTAAEVDAPGLWLARIGLDPDLPDGTTFEIPDDLSGLSD